MAIGIGFYVGINQEGNGGGNSFPLFSIPDLNIVSRGFFIGTGFNILVGTTTTLNDSLLFPANNLYVIDILKKNNLYTTFYTDDSHPIKLIWKDLLYNYNDIIYYNLKGTNDFIMYKTPFLIEQYEENEYEYSDYILDNTV